MLDMTNPELKQRIKERLKRGGGNRLHRDIITDILKRYAAGESVVAIAERHGVSPVTVYRHLRAAVR